MKVKIVEESLKKHMEDHCITYEISGNDVTIRKSDITELVISYMENSNTFVFTDSQKGTLFSPMLEDCEDYSECYTFFANRIIFCMYSDMFGKIFSFQIKVALNVENAEVEPEVHLM